MAEEPEYLEDSTAATFQNAAKTKLESSLDAQTEFQCGFELSVIIDSELESSLDVQANIQFGFECDQCF